MPVSEVRWDLMPFVTALFDLLKGIAWPIAIVLIALAFKVEIRALLPRLRKAGPTGVELDPAEQQREAPNSTAVTTTSDVIKDLPGISRTPAMEALERGIHAELQKRPEGDRVALAVRALAQSQLETAFERIYQWIFGSQILGLRRLHERTTVSVEDARQFFEEFRSKDPTAYGSYGFNEWLGFLINQGLVRRDGDAVTITEIGRDFLQYLFAQRKAENKAL